MPQPKGPQQPTDADLFAVLIQWRRAPSASLACPACEAADLKITDRSARPHAEWYVFGCKACGLDRALHIPMASQPPGT